MHNKISPFVTRMNYALYATIALTLLGGLILSIISWLEVCTQECSDAHHYQFFGLSFGMIGIFYFSVMILFHLIAFKIPLFTMLTGFMIAGGLGAEIMLIIIQKYVIGKWCPVCLSIAGMIFIAALSYFSLYMIELDLIIKKSKRGKIMQSIWKGISSISIFAVGFILTFVGIGKEDKLQAAQSAIEQNLVFGNNKSPITVFVFTDWQCPACREAEPAIEKMFSSLSSKAQVVFVDLAIHPESLNFIPYNLSFIFRNKTQYIQLRHILTNLATETDSPTDEMVESAVSKVGITYQQLSYSDIVLGIRYFRKLVQDYNIQGTPTVIVTNTHKNVKKRLSGSDAITEANILKAIDGVKGN